MIRTIDLSTGEESTRDYTQSELDAIAAIPATNPKDAILFKIESLERQQLMPRATREFMLMFMEANATPEILEVNPGYQAVKAFDNEIKVLRAKL